MPKGKRHSAQLKFKVALEAAKGSKTLSELASEYSLHPSQISTWKGQLLDEGPAIFSPTTTRGQREQETLQSELYEQIGRLKMELEWLKKKLPHELPAKRALVESDHPQLSIRRQCALLGLSRATLYYESVLESELATDALDR